MKTITLIFISLLGVVQIGYSSPWLGGSEYSAAGYSPTGHKHTKHHSKHNKTNATTPAISTDSSEDSAKSAVPVQKYYADGLCSTPGYTCIKTQPGDTWQKLFPNPIQRHIVQEVNRTDLPFRVGTMLAIPKNLAKITLLDIAPFPKKIAAMNNKLIMVDQDRLAWGAYDRTGYLVSWGAISSGRDYCPDVHGPCRTQTGEFYVFNKEGKKCKSGVFPVGEGGAIMPYCMFWYRGFALHGSLEVPGYRDSHGCVRMFIQDALWLNANFAETPAAKNNYLGTKVVIQKLTTPPVTPTQKKK